MTTGGNPWKVRSEVGDRLELDCGCVMDVVDTAFVVVPCSLTCPAYEYVVAENRQQNHPLEAILLDGPRPTTRDAYVGELNRAERRRRK